MPLDGVFLFGQAVNMIETSQRAKNVLAYATNLPALVQNKGWEVSIASTNIRSKHLLWNTLFNISAAKNKLISYPGLATSTYATQYEIGKSLGLWYNLQLAVARKLVFSKWQEALGGHVHFIVTGAAPMQARLIKLFTESITGLM